MKQQCNNRKIGFTCSLEGISDLICNYSMLAFKLKLTSDSWWLAISMRNFRHGKIDIKGDDIIKIRGKCSGEVSTEKYEFIESFKALIETTWKKVLILSLRYHHINPKKVPNHM